MTKRALVLSLLVPMLGVTTTGVAQASDDASFAALGQRLRPGDAVIVRGTDLGTVKGRLRTLSSDTMIVETESGARTIAASEINLIKRRRKGVLLGTLLGLGAGVAAGAALNSWFRNEGSDATAEVAAVVAAGAGTGLAIDAFIDLPRTVYAREQRATIVVDPRVIAGGAALRVHARF